MTERLGTLAAAAGLAACLAAGCGSEPPNVDLLKDEMDKAVVKAQEAQTVQAAETARNAAERLLAAALPGTDAHGKALDAAGRMAALRVRLLGEGGRASGSAAPDAPARRAPLTARSVAYTPPEPEPQEKEPATAEGPAEPGQGEPAEPEPGPDAPFQATAETPAVTVRKIETKGENVVCYIAFVNKTSQMVTVGAIHADFFSATGRRRVAHSSPHPFLRNGFTPNWTNVELSTGQRIAAESLKLRAGEVREIVLVCHSKGAKRVVKAKVEILMADNVTHKGEGP